MPSFVGGAAGLHCDDQRARAIRVVGEADTEGGAMRLDDVAVADELTGDVAHEVAGDRESDPGGCAAALWVTGRERGDTDHLSLEVDERSAAVAGVDRGAGLDRVGEDDALSFADVATDARSRSRR